MGSHDEDKPHEVDAHGAEPDEPSRGSRGGRALVEKYGARHMAEIGRKGSQSVVKKYGLRFYSEIASRNKGVKKRKSQKSEPAS